MTKFKNITIIIIVKSIILLLLCLFLMTSCYKKDLEEFKKVNSITEEIALPIFHSESIIHDSLNFIKPFESSDNINVSFPSPQDITLDKNITIDYIEFKNIVETDIPVEFYFQIYLKDINENVVDSIFKESYYINNGLNGMIIYTEISEEKYKIIQGYPNVKISYFIKFNGGGNKGSYVIKNEMGVKFKVRYRI